MPVDATATSAWPVPTPAYGAPSRSPASTRCWPSTPPSRRPPRQAVSTRYHQVPEMLDDRKAAVLRAVVREYIETALPVGSARVARSASLGVSAATVRNEMAALE